MNKIKQISLSVATLCAIVFVSCSSNEFDMRPSVATSEEHSELLSQMAYFNDSILEQRDKQEALFNLVHGEGRKLLLPTVEVHILEVELVHGLVLF